jgi:hypothetical protein
VRELAEEGIMTTDRTLASVLVGHVIELPVGDLVAIVNYERVGVLWLHARVVEPVTMTQGTVFLLDPAVALEAKLPEAQEHQQPAGDAGVTPVVRDPAPEERAEMRTQRDRHVAAAVEGLRGHFPPPAEECARCGTVGPVDVPCRGCETGCPGTGICSRSKAAGVRCDRCPQRPAPVHPRSPILDPGDESPLKPCCRRIGSSWCVAPDKHEGDHVPGAPDRELPVNPFDRGRARK